jgi:prephenate dehydrogenase
MRFNHITIVGVGLIGGSFALAARRAGIAELITGCDTQAAVDEAQALGVIDAAEESFELGRVCEADLVYLAAPVGGIVSFLRTRGTLLKGGAIVTDAGSTKREICRIAREALPKTVAFIGGHPMAGSEKSGVRFARADLFRGAPYALIRNENNGRGTGTVRELIEALEAVPIEMTAEQHDRIVARVSHAPQMLAIALALAAGRGGDAASLEAAGSGFAEMTRLAESRWAMWEDICRSNADEIGAAMDETIREIEAVRAAIASGDFAGLGEMFKSANDLLQNFHDVRRRIASRPKSKE